VQEILENCQNNTGDCADVKVEIAASEIPVPGIAFYNITGLTAPIEIVKVFNRRTYEKVFECNNNCGNSAFLELQEGAYVAQIQMYTANWGWICGRDIEFDVTTTDSPNLIDCDAITASYQFGLQDTYEGLGVEGLTAPIDIVKIYDANWNRVFECFGDCNNPTVVTDLAPNLYRVHAQQYDENWEQICETDFLEVTIPVSDGSLDRNSKNNIEFILFPNPVRNTLTINTSTLKGKKGSIQIYNILGHKITQMPNKFFDQAFETINLEHLENGLYYLNIQSNDFRAIGKQFIVEHLK